MACPQIARSGFSPAVSLRSGLPHRRLAASIRCRIEEGDGSRGEEAPESLFMKELRRRGMTPKSLLEEGKRGGGLELGEKEMEEASEEDVRRKKRNGVASVEFDKGVMDQRERSIALNSEGLEGLIPRAKLLLTIGGTFFLGFWPLILITVASFAALYLNLTTGMRIGSRHEREDIYYLDDNALITDFVADQSDFILQWHWRLGHPSLQKFRSVVSVQFLYFFFMM